ncbi:MAG: FecR domain-containing protein [Deltaproteobacteria bacterium]|nr:FecR domain-containing protein [Deltaproteobacteria bacterium]
MIITSRPRSRHLNTALPALLLCGLLAALLALPSLAEAGEVTYLKRPAEVKRKGTTKWEVLAQGMQVHSGDSIRTGMDARVEITIAPKRVFRIGQATEIELPQMESDAKKGTRTRVNLMLGRFWGGLISPLKEKSGEKFEVSTQTATIGVKGTQFGVDYDKETRASAVSVVEGVVAAVPPPQPEAPVEIEGPREIAPPQEISRDEWMVMVQKDQKVIIVPGEPPRTVPLTDEDKADEWVKFNMERDQALAASR